MQHDPTLEIPDESYFASFTDMLVGIIFIFIILLMIAANNFQEAADSVTKKKAADLVAKINDAHEKALDQARDNNLKNIQQNLFYEDREKVLMGIQQSLWKQGVPLALDAKQGILTLPENLLFDNNQDRIDANGKKVLSVVASALTAYLPCISPTKDPSRLAACGTLGLSTDNGLDAVFVEAHPDSRMSLENQWLQSMQRTVTVFTELTHDESYLDTDVRNISGIPILNIMANRERRQSKKRSTNLNLNQSVELRFVMRSPTPEEIKKLREAEDKKNSENAVIH